MALGSFINRYKEEAYRVGNMTVYNVLSTIPENGAETFIEALQFFRILNYALWVNGNYHITIGRFDQYMYPYYSKDVANGAMSTETAFDLIVETFLSLNKDSNIYYGVQQGDNGQSLVLGGCDKDGHSAFNELTELCLKASLENKMIDPKINLRVSRDTPIKWYILGSELTKAGLGFPQYSNDDVIVRALVDWGYELEDARNYVVAACWEFIVPAVGMDIPNIDAVNLPEILNSVIHEDLESIATFDELLKTLRIKMKQKANSLAQSHKNIYLIPSPFQSVLMKGSIQNGKDISEGGRYNNYGIHGSGFSTLVDSLCSIKNLVFDKKTLTAQAMKSMIQNNYKGFESIRKSIVINSERMGQNSEMSNDMAAEVIEIFSDSFLDIKNERGGIYRAGTGTAMYYIWHAQESGATADGRRKGEPYPANYSPSLLAQNPGIISVLNSFTPKNISRVANGGPLTIELHDSVFRNSKGVEKAAKLVEYFIQSGGHQLQINTVNAEVLKEAQKDPLAYKNLIVRVWGWSGYFTELDLEFQNHIIRRHEFNGT